MLRDHKEEHKGKTDIQEVAFLSNKLFIAQAAKEE